MASLRPILDTCTPRDDVRRGGLADNHFAAQLDQVVRNPKNYPVYGDPAQFFEITYPTKGLQDLLTRIFGRLSGANIAGAEHGTTRYETSFGGGKTHGLMAAYHLAKGARPKNLAEFVEPKLLNSKCQVVAIVGDTLDPLNGLETHGIRTHTLWGEMGAQLGRDAYEQVRKSDEDRTAPGKDTLSKLVGNTPTLVIIDELASHLRQLVSSGNPEVRRMAKAVPVFLKNLTELAAGNPRVTVIFTLATRSDAFGQETDELSELMTSAAGEFRQAVTEAQDIVTRVTGPGSILTPAADSEIGEILKRRLFERIDPDAAKNAATAYRALYEGLNARGEHLAGGPERPADYAQQIETSYPFHPELIRVLDQRIGSIGNFQRARGALKLLSEVIAGTWATNSDAEILNVADIDYGRPAVLSHLTVGIGRPDFEGVAKGDFAGKNSFAAQVDSNRFAGRTPYATRACRTVFTHSLEMLTTAGAGRNDYLLGTLRIGDEPEVISEALVETERLAWHLDYDGTRWKFTTEPQPNKIIAEEAKNVPNSTVAAEVADRVRKAFPKEGLVDVIPFPTGPGSVRDLPKLQLVVMHHDDLVIRSAKALPPPSKLVNLLDRAGVSEDLRSFRNGLAFLVADQDGVEGMKEMTRKDLAAQKIIGDRTRMESFTSEVRKKLQGIADKAGLEARVALNRCYRHLYFPTNDRANGHLKHEELPARDTGNVPTAQTRVVVDALKEFGKIRSQAMGIDYLRSRAWPKSSPEVTTEAVSDAFWKDHGAQLILDPTILQATIREGTRNGDWIYYVINEQRAFTAKDPPPAVKISRDDVLYTPERAEELGILTPVLRWEHIAEALKGKPSLDGATLRAELEKALGKEPTKGEILEVLSRAAEGGESARVVVVAGKPEPGAKAAPPSDIKRSALDGLTLMTPEEADRLSTVRPGGTKRTTVESVGPPGVAFQSLIDKATDVHDVAGFSTVSVTAAADPGGTVRDISLLSKAIGMLPRFDIEIETGIELDFKGLTPGVEISLKGPAKEYQKIDAALMAFAKAAAGASGTLRLDIRFAKPAALASDDLRQLRKVLTDLLPGEIRLKGVLA